MIICITGASGFIGKKLVEKQLKLGWEIRYLTRTDIKPIIGAQAFVGDVNATHEKLLPFFKNADVFYNCAGELENEDAMRSTHVQGTINLLSLLEKSRRQLQNDFHWIQLSSCGAYGQAISHPSIARYVDEDTQDSPSGEYECTKTEADNLIVEFSKKNDWFKYTIIRPSNVFGVGMRSTAIMRIAQMIKIRLFFYIGNKNAIANFVHLDDVVNAMMLSAKQHKAYNQIFIVSNDCKFTDVVNTIADTLKKSKPSWVVSEFLLRKFVEIAGKFIRLPIGSMQIDVMLRQTYYNNKKIRNELNWSPKAPILQQLKIYIEAVFSAKNA